MRGADEQPEPEGVLARVGAALTRSPGQIGLMVDASFTIRWASDAATAILGHRDLVGQNVLGLLHPDDVDRALMGIVHHSENADVYAGIDRSWLPDPEVIRARHADGSWVRMEVTLFNLLEDAEVGSLFALCRRVRDDSDLELAIDLLGRGSPIDEVLPVVARLVDRTNDGTRCQIVWCDGEIRRLSQAHGTDPLPEPPADLLDAASASATAQYRGRLGQQVDPDPAVLAAGFDAVSAVPVTTPGTHEVIGMVVLWSEVTFDLILNHADLPSLRLASLAIVDHLSKGRLRWAAHHDALTATRNRAGFAEAVGANEGPCALLYVDLDDFKPVNDRFGHEAGDRVLVRVAERIGRVVRDVDVVARMGGDEFAVLCPGLSERDAGAIATRIRRSVSRPISIDGEPVRVGVSVGLALATGEEEHATLLHRADRSLYVAKAEGKRRRAAATST